MPPKAIAPITFYPEAHKLLDAVTATGASTVIQTRGSKMAFGLQVVLGGTVVATGVVVKLEGSLDGINFFTLATWDKSTPQSSGDIVFAYLKPVHHVRLNLSTLSGGTAPTVTAWLSMA
jgi:hypothetical protein